MAKVSLGLIKNAYKKLSHVQHTRRRKKNGNNARYVYVFLSYSIFVDSPLFLMYNLLKYKQIAIAKINKSTPTHSRAHSCLPAVVRRALPSFFFHRALLFGIVYRISFITQNIHIYLHYTFENLLQLALILARGGRSICASAFGERM